MSYEKILNTILAASPNLLTIKEHTSFAQIIEKVSSKKCDFILLVKPQANQMAAVLTLRLIGRKFFWIQKFTNPPTPSFLARFLLTQADRIITESKAGAKKLNKLGIDKSKIRFQKN